ncbi:ATP-binding cassette domain-containing protein [Heliobacterium gestii]|uniref:ATP-binding cassette domain-containing protein n=1 Tax=Heliomicrobium gestii TaxID=2699 RepID=A0A845LBG0_HELGE|nr:ABC transporter ATP-binding protein [Heliomicrobium gestii]MBM7866024.1 ABC-2 type transport system ATP-binding protein [Heliomicrobium gestii]MZP42644.1 ATP-binding cassette domain-containing protein [Heliomicrobium gestii]
MEQSDPLLFVDIRHGGYSDKKEAIRDIRFSLQPGEMMGLIGANGAGKSTTIKAILGLLPELNGEIRLGGAEQRLAYVPEQPIYYEELTLWEHMELAAAAHGLGAQIFQERALSLLHRFRMEPVRDHLPESFSKGMQQKMMLILAFLLEPEVFIVDEPFVGLDPQATLDLLSQLAAARRRGAAVLLSTHVLDTAEKICDTFTLIDEGRVVAKGTLDHLREQSRLPGGSLFDCFHRLLENRP